MLRSLAIISPSLPPTINGLGDYCVQIGPELSLGFNEIFYFSSEQSNINYYSFNNSVTQLLALFKKLHITHILFNYSGYGYHSKGLPIWIIRAVKKCREMGIVVAIFFHEIFSSSQFPKPSYWLGLLQKNLFKSIYNNSDLAFCSNSVVSNLISDLTNDKGAKCKMVGLISNIPEILQTIDWSQRYSTAVVFGTKGRRKLVYQNHQLWLPFLIKNNISTIIDIGEDLDDDFPILPIPITKMSILPKEGIAKHLEYASFGLIDYPFHLLTKSGIFASYAAFGVIPVCMNNQNMFTAGDGLIVDKHFINIHNWASEEKIKFSLISNNLNQWYSSNNSIKIHSEKIISAFDSISRNK